MWNMIWPVLIVVASNCFYNICAKSAPEGANAFGMLTITYLTAAVIAGTLFVIQVKPGNVLTELSKTNWTSFVLGFAIVGLEFGYIYLYRNGWRVGAGSLVANICLAVALLIIGVLLYREAVTVRQLIGVAVCAAGLFLITKP